MVIRGGGMVDGSMSDVDALSWERMIDCSLDERPNDEEESDPFEYDEEEEEVC